MRGVVGEAEVVVGAEVDVGRFRAADINRDGTALRPVEQSLGLAQPLAIDVGEQAAQMILERLTHRRTPGLTMRHRLAPACSQLCTPIRLGRNGNFSRPAVGYQGRAREARAALH